jgi:CDP-4-dehydro-6-deoxyglucose reductase
MGNLIGLARAAQLLGIGRRELQRLIQKGDLATFEGCVDVDELRRRYPTLGLQDGSILERISFLQETAFARRVRETVMPDVDDLAGKLKKRTADLAVERARARHYCTVLRDLTAQIAAMHAESGPETRERLEALNCWLIKRLDGEDV